MRIERVMVQTLVLDEEEIRELLELFTAYEQFMDKLPIGSFRGNEDFIRRTREELQQNGFIL